MKLLRLFDDLMKLLPGDGQKTASVAVVSQVLVPLAAALIPGFQPVAALLALDKVSAALVALFAAHKAVKEVIKRQDSKMED